jgi:hypothetical protein
VEEQHTNYHAYDTRNTNEMIARLKWSLANCGCNFIQVYKGQFMTQLVLIFLHTDCFFQSTIGHDTLSSDRVEPLACTLARRVKEAASHRRNCDFQTAKLRIPPVSPNVEISADVGERASTYTASWNLCYFLRNESCILGLT